ncbi:prefoldin subunit 5-like isoform X2 [Halictus rubicundus]|uniref:prefoldin subunit 5-like isoform X2 n=1 Tax=Halictus rubicundus TaxID=77578 RepID=UPI00403583E9
MHSIYNIITERYLHQLTALKQQLDHELDIFQESLQTLKTAQNEFQESGSCLEKIPAMKGNEILVPLTGSMYVPGRLKDVDNVLIDIGTGYFTEKNVAEAKEYFNRKVDYITEQMDKVEQLGLDKCKIRDQTVDIIETKLQNQGYKRTTRKA